jgi:hypothetical protein
MRIVDEVSGTYPKEFSGMAVNGIPPVKHQNGLNDRKWTNFLPEPNIR